MNKPDDSETDCTTFDVLFQPLAGFLAQHERDHPPHHREQLHFKEFVRLLVYHFAKGCESGRQLLTDVSTAEPELELGEVKRSTFFEAFQRFPVAWFGSMLSFLLVTVAWPTIPELEGWVDRERLLDIQGRSRKRQLELARAYGLTEHASPAGGCASASCRTAARRCCANETSRSATISRDCSPRRPRRSRSTDATWS